MNDVESVVTVDIADTKSVAKFFVRNLSRYGYKLPRLKRLAPIDVGVTEKTIACANQFGPLVSNQLNKTWRLVGNPIENLMLLPSRCFPRLAWILVNICRRTRETDSEYIHPAIGIEIIGPRKKMIGVSLSILRLRLVDLKL